MGIGAEQDLVAEAGDFGRREEDGRRDEVAQARGGVFPGVQDGKDRRMVEGGEGAGLAFEAAGARGAVRGSHRLERHVAAERAIARQPDLPHAALAERAEKREGVVDDEAGTKVFQG